MNSDWIHSYYDAQNACYSIPFDVNRALIKWSYPAENYPSHTHRKHTTKNCSEYFSIAAFQLMKSWIWEFFAAFFLCVKKMCHIRIQQHFELVI